MRIFIREISNLVGDNAADLNVGLFAKNLSTKKNGAIYEPQIQAPHRQVCPEPGQGGRLSRHHDPHLGALCFKDRKSPESDHNSAPTYGETGPYARRYREDHQGQPGQVMQSIRPFIAATLLSLTIASMAWFLSRVFTGSCEPSITAAGMQCVQK